MDVNVKLYQECVKTDFYYSLHRPDSNIAHAHTGTSQNVASLQSLSLKGEEIHFLD